MWKYIAVIAATLAVVWMFNHKESTSKSWSKIVRTTESAGRAASKEIAADDDTTPPKKK